MSGYRVEVEVEGIAFDGTCQGCGAPRVETESNVVRIHRPGCRVADRMMGEQQELTIQG